MRRCFSEKWIMVLVILLLSAVCVQAAEEKTLTRTEDAVVVLGASLKKCLGRDNENLTLMAYRNNKLEAVPFQIDEVDKNGKWVLTMVPPALKDKTEPGVDEDNGKLDDNDQLAFMINDAGDRLPGAKYPAGAVVAVDEITISDSQGRKGWVYLCAYKTCPPRSSVSYVRYDAGKDLVIADSYQMACPKELAIAPGDINFPGKDDILDAFKVRVVATVFGISIRINETRFVSNLSKYQAGPVRIIRRTENAIEVYKFLRSPAAGVENLYYRNAISVPISIALPINVSTWDKMIDIESYGAADFYNMKGWQIKTNIDQVWYDVDGRMDAKENAMPKDNFRWFCLKGDGNAFMIRIVMDRKKDGSPQKSPLSTGLYYLDDDSLVDTVRETVPGQSPQVGFTIGNIDKMNKGELYFFATMYPIYNYKNGDESKYNDMVDNPLKVTVTN